MTGQALIDALGNVAVELDEDNFATNARAVREAAAELDRLTALVRQTREEADAAVQRAAEGELAARTEVERLTARLQTAEKVRAEASTVHELTALADKLKAIEPCAAASIEGRSCVTADVRWCGRQIARIAGFLATNAVEAERDEQRIRTAEKAAHEWRERCEGMWSKAHVEAAFRAWLHEGVALNVDALTLEEREAPAWADFRWRIEAEKAGA